jgi:DNA-binding HxlR family transcriptional regulator
MKSPGAARYTRGDLSLSECPSRRILDHVTSRWGTLVLVLLRDGTQRFSELRDRIGGVSEKMLAQSLRVLEEDGFVLRRAYPEVPPRVEYSLTPLGTEGAAHLDVLAKWVEANTVVIEKARQKRVARSTRPAPR